MRGVRGVGCMGGGARWVLAWWAWPRVPGSAPCPPTSSAFPLAMLRCAVVPPPGLPHTHHFLSGTPGGLCCPPSEHPSRLCSRVLLDAARCPIFLGWHPFRSHQKVLTASGTCSPVAGPGGEGGTLRPCSPGSWGSQQGTGPRRRSAWIRSPCPLLRPVAHRMCSCAPGI